MKRKIWPKVYKDMELQISLGKWPVGSIIPSEQVLAAQYKVSRDTIRRALAELTMKGYFERKPHVGTRVKSKHRAGKFFHELDDIYSIDRYGNTYPRIIKNIDTVLLTDADAERLGVPNNSKMIRFENIRQASESIQSPVVVTFVYIFPEAQGIISLLNFHSTELIVNLVQQETDRECTEVKQTFSATKMPAKVAEYFKEVVGSPCLRIVRNYLDCRAKTMVVSESFHPADKFSFAISVKKN